MALTSYTALIQHKDVEKLRGILLERGFELGMKPYTYYNAKKEKLNVAVYEKGPKVFVQGRDTEDFVKFILEPEILGVAKLGNEEVLEPEMFSPHFGVDESGKGDYFGPLVIAGVYTDRDIARRLIDLGVTDSKKIANDKKIKVLADAIRGVAGVAYETIVLKPEKYNELYAKFKNLNRLLAWGHARVIASLAEQRPACRRTLSDQFARAQVLELALRQQGATVEHLQLQQRTKGESDVAVAAASILAREAFVGWIQRASDAGKVTLPLGAGPHVLDAAREVIARHGTDILPKVAKLHFKTTQQI